LVRGVDAEGWPVSGFAAVFRAETVAQAGWRQTLCFQTACKRLSGVRRPDRSKKGGYFNTGWRRRQSRVRPACGF